jgi:hypothetical protein
MNLYNIVNSNIHSQAGAWERGRSPVGRTALCPTSVYVTNNSYRSISTFYTYFHLFYWIFDLCRFLSDRGQSDLRLFENLKHDNLPYFSHKLFFNVKIMKKL